MKPMTYDRAFACYYDVLLDMAKLQSGNIFDAISEAVTDASILNDLKDIMVEWYGLRKTIVDELR